MNVPFKNPRANWMIVLEMMYDMQISVDIEKLHSIDHPNPEQYDRLMKETELGHRLVHESSKLSSNKELDYSLDYLIDKGFIEEIGPKNDGEYQLESDTFSYQPTINLTQDGLQLAHQIKTERQRRNTNILLLALTFLLSVLTTILVGVEIVALL